MEDRRGVYRVYVGRPQANNVLSIGAYGKIILKCISK